MSALIELLGGPDDGRVVALTGPPAGVFYTVIRGRVSAAQEPAEAPQAVMRNVYRAVPGLEGIRKGRRLHRFEGVERA